MAEERADHRLFSIVIPTYNEVGNVGAMVSELGRRYPGVKVIIVDDNSQDGTVQAVEALLGSNPGLKLIRRDPADRGLTASVMDGIMSVGTERFVVMDCDFQHPPVYVGQLMKATDSADLVVAAREGMGPLSLGRRVASSGAHKLASFYLWFRRRPRSSDLMSGFFAGRTALAKSITASCPGMPSSSTPGIGSGTALAGRPSSMPTSCSRSSGNAAWEARWPAGRCTSSGSTRPGGR
ncbi:MAG: glycosyltransferase [Methanomassiliicoccales archaeon]|nr:glycosyltransferase [Methanomassiliicoccales archaeon]